MADGALSLYKASLVICGNLDEAPLDHTFSPVVDFKIVRLVLSIASKKRWLINQVDYRNEFPLEVLDLEVFTSVPSMLNRVPHGKFVYFERVCMAYARRLVFGIISCLKTRNP